VARYEGPEPGTDWANALGVSPDGSRVFVTGYSYGGGLHVNDYATVAYNSGSGAQLWEARLAGRKEDVANALAINPDGSTVWVTGYSQGLPGNYDYATEAYDAATGANTGEMRYNHVGRSDDEAQAIAVSPDGTKVFVTGKSEHEPGINFDWATAAYQI
jgi:DNA-binding beta-propeller fold protein YncE